jgi:type IV pilus assembly protein PilE
MKHSKGFSLIELMIVVAIVGILSTIALGFYGDNVIASNRSEARAALTQTAASLEKCKSLYGAFNSPNCAAALALPDTSPAYYSIDQTTLTGVQFTLVATPKAGLTQANDADCDTLSLTNIGVKAGTGLDPTVCW